VNSVDALMINKNYICTVNGFKAGVWIFENDTIKLNGSNIIHDLKGLCFGDVNGSFTPQAKKIFNFNLIEVGIIYNEQISTNIPKIRDIDIN
jgi:hypothetical protein